MLLRNEEWREKKGEKESERGPGRKKKRIRGIAICCRDLPLFSGGGGGGWAGTGHA